VFALGIFALSFSAPLRADDKTDIAALYKRVSASLKAKDVKGVVATGTPDFVSIENGTKMDAKQSQKMLEMEFQSMKSIKELYYKPTKIEVKGTNATVLSNFKMVATMGGEGGKTHEMTGSGTSKETLLKTKKGWLIKSMETLTSKSTMDGKPMQMPAPPPQTKKKP